MAKTERITGAYNLSATGGITLASDTTVGGNLTITGTTTTITTTNTEIKDRVITLNDGESGAGVTGQYSGLEIDRGSSNNAFIVFDEVSDTFQISTDGGSTYDSILTGVGAGLTAVVQDTSPQLGGDLDLNSFNIVSAQSNEDIQLVPNGTGRVTIASALKLNDLASAPASATGATLLYADTAGGGGSGVYFVDGSTSDELVSKSKAIVYGLIF
jgi:hypothetical protein